MKLQAAIPAILFAAVSSLSVGAFAADAEKAPMKPQSHMQEKAGMAPKAAPEEKKAEKQKAAKPDATKDKTRHLHPRDGK